MNTRVWRFSWLGLICAACTGAVQTSDEQVTGEDALPADPVPSRTEAVDAGAFDGSTVGDVAGQHTGDTGGVSTPDASDPHDAAKDPLVFDDAQEDAFAAPSMEELSACDLGITQIAAYQSLKIPLWQNRGVVTNRNAAVVAGRKTLFRVFVAPGEHFNPRVVTVRMMMTTPAGTETFNREVMVAGPSVDNGPATTGNFIVNADRIDTTTELAFQLLAGECDAIPASDVGPRRIPAFGSSPLQAVQSAPIRMRLVPIRYLADGSNRMPDTSMEQIERYRSLLEAMFPVDGSQVTLRDPVGLTQAIDSAEAWEQALDGLRGLRSSDAPTDDVYYMGLVVPADRPQDYCQGRCIAGIAYNNRNNVPGLRVGLSLGFSGDTAARVVMHELGHTHGLGHAPCNTTTGVDETFPYAMGGIGDWGFDPRNNTIFSPAHYKDFMGYCDPHWISDHAYEKMRVRVQMVGLSQALAAARPKAPDVTTVTYLGLQVSADGKTRWGETWTAGPGAGTPEVAVVHDDKGTVAARPTVYRVSIGDSGGALVLVPPPQPHWARITIAGVQSIAFAAASSGPVFVE